MRSTDRLAFASWRVLNTTPNCGGAMSFLMQLFIWYHLEEITRIAVALLDRLDLWMVKFNPSSLAMQPRRPVFKILERHS